MGYTVTVYGYDSGLNELLNHQEKRYDPRTKRMRVYNNEKRKNDKLCVKAINESEIKGVRIKKPIFVHYHFFCKDKMRDKTNIAYAFCKSFLDSLQICKVIPNDGWANIENVDFSFEVDKHNPRVVVDIEVLK